MTCLPNEHIECCDWFLILAISGLGTEPKYRSKETMAEHLWHNKSVISHLWERKISIVMIERNGCPGFGVARLTVTVPPYLLDDESPIKMAVEYAANSSMMQSQNTWIKTTWV